MKDYEYLISFSDNEEIKEKLAEIEEIQSIEYYSFDGKNALKYYLADDVDEYGVFVKVCEIVQNAGEEIGFIDEESVEKESETIVKDESEEDAKVQTVSEVKKEAKKKKKLTLSGNYMRIAEIVIAFMIYLIFGVEKFVPVCLCLAIVAYEIFYDAINDIGQKRFTDNVAVSFTLLFLVAGTYFKICFFTAFAFSVIKIVYAEVIKLLKRKNFAYFSLGEISVNGENASVEAVKKGDTLILDKEAYFDSEIVEGEGELLVNGQKGFYKKGDFVPFGATVTEVNSFIVKSKESYPSSKLCEAVEREKSVMEKIDKTDAYSKKSSLISLILFIALIIVSVVLAVVLYSEFAFVRVLDWLARLSPIAVLCSPICNFFFTLSNHCLYYAFCKKNALNGDIEELIKLSDGVVYEEGTLSEEGVLYEDAYGILRELKDLGINEQICVSKEKSDTLEGVCTQLKLKRFINGISDEELEELVKDKIFVCKEEGEVVLKLNGKVVFVVKERLREIPQAVRCVKGNLKTKKVVVILSAVTFAVCACLGVSLIISTLQTILLGFAINLILGAVNLFQLIK